MDEFHYSDEAENVLSLFHQAEVMVYVEGPDDVCFWETVFNKISTEKVHVQDVGGCKELDKYIKRIIEEDLKVVVACDSDYVDFTPRRITHNRIINTPGHSIENTFITEEAIFKTIKNLGKFTQRYMITIDVNSWQTDLYSKLEKLIKLEIHNEVSQKGVSILGDNSDRFMKSKKSYEICQNKITAYEEKLQEKINDFDPELIQQEIDNKSSDCKRWLRGHFLFSAVHRFISINAEKSGRKISLSYESLYSNLISLFENAFNEQHSEYVYFQQKITNISI